MFIRNKTHYSAYSIGILALVVLLGFCPYYLSADDTSQTEADVSPVQIGVKYQQIKALYKQLLTKNNPKDELETLAKHSSDFVESFPDYKRVDEVYYYLGNTLVRLKRVEDGIKVFEKLATELPDARYLQPSLLELGMAYDKLSNHEKANEVYTKLIEHPKFGERSYAKQAKKILGKDISERKGEIPEPAIQRSVRPSEWIGKPAPDFKVKDVNGEDLSLEKYRGQVVLLDFWATWCGPCIVELPNVKRTYENYKDHKFQILGISLDRSKPSLDAFIKKEGLAWDHYWDNDEKITGQYGVTGIPSMFLLDGTGVIRKANLRGATLERAVAELVAENLAKPADVTKNTASSATPQRTIPATKMLKIEAPKNNDPQAKPDPSEWVGKPAPEFKVTDVNGEELSLEKYRGQVVLLDFWATWCGPCIAEMPKLKQTYEKYKDQNFQIIGISLDGSKPPLDAYIEKEALAWEHYWDEDRKVRDQYSVWAIPTAFLIDGEGIIRKASLGGFDVETAVANLLKENPAKPVKPAPPKKPPADTPDIGQNDPAKVKEIVDAATAVHGGLEKLKAVKNIVIESQTFEYFSDGTVQDEGINKTYYYPDKFRSEWDRDSLIFDGETLFQMTDGMLNHIPEDKAISTIRFMKDSLFREPIWLLTNLSENDVPVKYVGTANIKEDTASVLLITMPSGKNVKVFFSNKTHYLVRYIYNYDMGNAQDAITVSLDDYRDVDGVKIAHHRTTKNGEHRQVLIKDIQLNADIDDALFLPNRLDE